MNDRAQLKTNEIVTRASSYVEALISGLIEPTRDTIELAVAKVHLRMRRHEGF